VPWKASAQLPVLERSASKVSNCKKKIDETSMASRTALLLGGSGLVGGFCLQILLNDPAYGSVISVARRKLQVAPHPKLLEKVLPFEKLASLELPPLDDVFCALGTTIGKAGSQEAFRQIDYQFPLAAADHALKFGAKTFVLISSVGADPKSKNFYLRTKGELEETLRKLPFTGMHILRPSLLLGKRTESRPGESIAIGAARVLQFLCVGPLRKYHPVSAMTVAEAMVGAARTDRQGTAIYEYNYILGAADLLTHMLRNAAQPLRRSE
jgi:uncharacterized protein YbjT (DUF2867 family)